MRLRCRVWKPTATVDRTTPRRRKYSDRWSASVLRPPRVQLHTGLFSKCLWAAFVRMDSGGGLPAMSAALRYSRLVWQSAIAGSAWSRACQSRTQIVPFIFAKRRHAMHVDPSHGRCRECDGELTIIDADDATMTVECRNCAEVYLVEPDAFGDGAMDYYTGFLTGRHPELLP